MNCPSQNITRASAEEVTIRTPQNEYSYKPRNLFIAYGVGILITFAIVIAGVFCRRAISLCFGTSFSAILRTTRNTELDSLVLQDDVGNVGPLSKQLEETILRFRSFTSETGSKPCGKFVVCNDGDELERI